MIKAIFFDIDGTLVSFKTHYIPASTLEAIRAVRKRGVKVFIATGRPMPFVDNLGAIEFDGLMTANGADCRTTDGTVVRHQPIQKSDLHRLITYYHQHPFPLVFAANDEIFITEFSREAIEVLELLNIETPLQAPVEHCLDIDVVQIIAFFKEGDDSRLMSEVLQGCSAQRWHPCFADVICAGNNKAVGIDAIIQHYGIRLEETMAFGDGGNDITMLRHVGYGIAMGNARDEVKSVADYVTDTVDEDGVVQALHRFVLDD